MAATALAELYRQQELEVPILVPRDGPIAALDPDRTGLLARPRRFGRRRDVRRAAEVPAALIGAGGRVGRGARRRRPRRRRTPAAGRGRRARRLDPGLPGQRHGALREHPREGPDLYAARGHRDAADLGRQLRVGLRPGRRDAARAARQRHQGDAGRRAGAAGDRRALRGGDRGARGDLAGLRRRAGRPGGRRRDPVIAASAAGVTLPPGCAYGPGRRRAARTPDPMTHNPIRPWRNIDRRRSRQHPRRAGAGRRRRADQRADDDQHADHRRRRRRSRRCRPAPTPGADIVRVSCPDEGSTRALREIVRESPVPIVADIHFHYRRAIEAAEAGAACLRINPGNIGSAERVREVIKAARDHGCSMRIGVNAGSLERHLLEKYGEPCPEAMVESGLDHIRILEDNDFHEFKISVKASDVFLAAAAYQGLAEATDAPIHLGITEAGGLMTRHGQVGDRARQPALDGDRRHHPRQPLGRSGRGGEGRLRDPEGRSGLRHRGVNIISCPSCARQGFDVIKTVEVLEKRLEHIKTPMSLSIIGCVVNGPGEALMTDVGFTGGGAGSGMVYLAGKQDHKLDNAGMVDHIVELVEKRAAEIEAEHAAAAEGGRVAARACFGRSLAADGGIDAGGEVAEMRVARSCARATRRNSHDHATRNGAHRARDRPARRGRAVRDRHVPAGAAAGGGRPRRERRRRRSSR